MLARTLTVVTVSVGASLWRGNHLTRNAVTMTSYKNAPRHSRPVAPTARLLALGLLCLAGCTGTRSLRGELVQEDTADVNGTTLAYEVRGQGPAVVLLHGGGFDRRLWDGQVDVLAVHFTVVRYDARGFGQSGGSEGAPYAHHEDLAALLDRLRIERAALVGQSLGGRVAVDLALTRPDLVRALVLVGPGLSGWPWSAADFGPWLADFRTAVQARDTLGAVEAWLASGYMASAAARPELRGLLHRLARENARAWMADDAERELAPPALGRLDALRVPTLLVLGSRDEPVIHRIADSLGVAMPCLRRAVLEGAGHAPNLEEPERFNEEVIGFLRSLEPCEPGAARL